MKKLEDRILAEGKVYDGGILKVGSFLNQQIDSDLMLEIGEEIKRLYLDAGVTKILTVEASGIAIALAAGMSMHVPVVFAKKNESLNIQSSVYSASVFSYTHQKLYNIVVSEEYLNENDRILLVDDFLANGEALRGLIELVSQANATLCGCAVAVEKGFQHGGDGLRAEGIRVEALALVESMKPGEIIFR